VQAADMTSMLREIRGAFRGIAPCPRSLSGMAMTVLEFTAMRTADARSWRKIITRRAD
jgi:hypothetical protein